MSDEVTGLLLLRKPFPPNQISKLPKPTSKDAKKGRCAECGGWHGLPAVHLDYVGHAALTDRLLDTDPMWSWEPVAFDANGLPCFDKNGGLWIRLTVCGVTRLGYGNAEDKPYMDVGAREKEVIGDALRNAAMRFGAALDLWHKGDLHGTDEEKEEPKKSIPAEDLEIVEQELRDASLHGTEALKLAWKGQSDAFREALSDKLPALKKAAKLVDQAKVDEQTIPQ